MVYEASTPGPDLSLCHRKSVFYLKMSSDVCRYVFNNQVIFQTKIYRLVFFAFIFNYKSRKKLLELKQPHKLMGIS